MGRGGRVWVWGGSLIFLFFFGGGGGGGNRGIRTPMKTEIVEQIYTFKIRDRQFNIFYYARFFRPKAMLQYNFRSYRI